MELKVKGAYGNREGYDCSNVYTHCELGGMADEEINSTQQKSYDLMDVVILNLGDADQKSDQEILNLLNVLFSADIPPEEKKERLSNNFHIAMTEELESEVRFMCNLSHALVEQGVQQGIQQGVQQGEDMLARLIQKLFSLGRAEDVRRVAEDQEYRNTLMKELL